MGPHDPPRRVIFLNRFFYPDLSPTSELLSDLAFALAKRGFHVAVITSRQKYENATARLPPLERCKGVDVWRVWTSRRGRSRLVGRSLDYLTFYLAAGWRLLRVARSGDIIVAKTDPPLLSVVAAPIAWLTGAKLVNWLQDIFPEVAEELKVGGSLGGLALRLTRPLRNKSLKAASANVVVGRGMAACLVGQGISRESIRVIENWSDGKLIRPVAATKSDLRQRWALDDRFVVGYAGNLGRAHDVETIIHAMSLLQERATEAPANSIATQIMFLFVGGGAQRARLEQEVLKRRLRNVRLHPYQPKKRLAATLGLADVHLISLNPKLEGLIVPSKFYSIVAAGRPTLFIGAANGEIANLIDGAGCGFTIAPGDGKALAERILHLASNPGLCESLGAQARHAFEQHWDRSHALAKWEELLKAVMGRTGEDEPPNSPPRSVPPQ